LNIISLFVLLSRELDQAACAALRRCGGR